MNIDNRGSKKLESERGGRKGIAINVAQRCLELPPDLTDEIADELLADKQPESVSHQQSNRPRQSIDSETDAACWAGLDTGSCRSEIAIGKRTEMENKNDNEENAISPLGADQF